MTGEGTGVGPPVMNRMNVETASPAAQFTKTFMMSDPEATWPVA